MGVVFGEYGRIPACGWWILGRRHVGFWVCSAARSEGGKNGGGPRLSRHAQGTAVVPPWFAGDARGGGGRPVLWVLREEEGEEEKQRREGGRALLC